MGSVQMRQTALPEALDLRAPRRPSARTTDSVPYPPTPSPRPAPFLAQETCGEGSLGRRQPGVRDPQGCRGGLGPAPVAVSRFLLHLGDGDGDGFDRHPPLAVEIGFRPHPTPP